jgi:hypothetical protein
MTRRNRGWRAAANRPGTCWWSRFGSQAARAGPPGTWPRARRAGGRRARSGPAPIEPKRRRRPRRVQSRGCAKGRRGGCRWPACSRRARRVRRPTSILSPPATRWSSSTGSADHTQVVSVNVVDGRSPPSGPARSAPMRMRPTSTRRPGGWWPCTAARPRLVGCVRAGAAVGSSTGPLFVRRPGGCRLRPRRLGRFGARRPDSTAS